MDDRARPAGRWPGPIETVLRAVRRDPPARPPADAVAEPEPAEPAVLEHLALLTSVVGPWEAAVHLFGGPPTDPKPGKRRRMTRTARRRR